MTEPARPHPVPPPARNPGPRTAPAGRGPGAARQHAPAKRRASKGFLRTLAWVGGAVGFVSPWAVLAAAPKPVAAQPAAPTVSPRPTIIVHHIIRRVIVEERAPAVSGPVTTTSGGGTVYVPAAPPPVASSGGSSP